MLLPNNAAVQHSHLKHRRIVSGPHQLARCRLGGALRLAVPLRVVPAGVLADRDLVNRDKATAPCSNFASPYDHITAIVTERWRRLISTVGAQQRGSVPCCGAGALSSPTCVHADDSLRLTAG